MRILVLAMVLASGSAQAATSICRPTFQGFLEFECQTKEPAIKAASFCDVMNRQGGPVRWSRNDTNETKNRADVINAVGKRLCGWAK